MILCKLRVSGCEKANAEKSQELKLSWWIFQAPDALYLDNVDAIETECKLSQPWK